MFNDYTIFNHDISDEYYDKRGKPITHEEFLNDEEGKAVMQKALIYLQEIGK